jgi:hypothetical protein
MDGWASTRDIIWFIEQIIKSNTAISLIATSNLSPDSVENILVDPAILPEIVLVESISDGDIAPLSTWCSMKIKNDKHLIGLSPRQEIVDETIGIHRRVSGDGI